MNPYMLAGLLGMGLLGSRRSDALANPPTGSAPTPAQAFPIPMPESGSAKAFPVQGIGVPQIPMYPDEFYKDPSFLKFAQGMQESFNVPSEVQLRSGVTPEMYGQEMIGTPSAADLSWMDTVSPSQQAAIGTGALPGSMNLGMLGGLGASLLKQAGQDQPLPVGQITRGNPQAVNYGSLIDLLAPKRTASRKLSLL